jgi:3-oxoadipate enol-lactonase
MKAVGDTANPNIAPFYAEVPPAELEQFEEFRRAFPYRYLEQGGRTWPYLLGGQDAPPLLFLCGALPAPEISWASIRDLAAGHRLIAPAYPPVATMEALADGIAAILRREGVEAAQVLGGSYGGAVAQVFARRHPGMTSSLVLAQTQAPLHAMASRARRLAASLHWLPMSALRRVVRRTFGTMLPPWSDETACSLAVFEELVSSALEKRDAVAILERMADFSRLSFTSRDLRGWPGRVLLIFGDEDPSTPPRLRADMEALYPGSRLRILEAGGAEISLTRRGDFVAAIEDFLSETAGPSAFTAPGSMQSFVTPG